MPPLLDNNRNHARRMAKQIGDSRSPDSGLFGGIWHWVNGVASGIGHFIDGPIVSALRAILNHLENIDAAFQDDINAIERIIFWWERALWHTLQGYITRRVAKVRAELRREVTHLIRLIYVATRTVLALAYAAVARERHERKVAVGRAEARARAQVKALHTTIEREAASGYRITSNDRASLIVRLLDFAVTRNPEIRVLVKDIAGGILDLLEIDDPPLRLLLGFLIKHVIDKLGIDKAVGVLIDDLLAPVLGKKKPHDIHDVILDLSQRMLAVEKQWAQFFEDGGSQVEQAGTDWRNITSLLGNTAIVAFTADAIAQPDEWAKELNKVVGKRVNDVALHAVRLFKE